jgi:glucokinase
MTHMRADRSEIVVGLDVGGSKVLAAEVSVDGVVAKTCQLFTPGEDAPPGLVEDALTEAVHEVAAGRSVAAVGLAAAGFVDAPAERVMFAPHLPWRDDPVRSRLQRRWGLTVVMDNDANCAAAAELAFGAARGASTAIVITLGTGIGGAVVLGGQVHRGWNGMAGEFGHMQVVPDGHPCECGRRGCWEQYCSGHALVRLVRAQLNHQPSLLQELSGGDPDALTGPMVTRAAADGDLVARKAFESVGEWLGVGVANLVAAFDPEVVVVAGGVSAAGERLLEPAHAALTRSLVGASHRAVPPLVAARFGPEAGVVGAAVLARDSLVHDRGA